MDARELLIQHFEKFALGVAGLVLLAIVGGSLFGKSEAQAASDRVDNFNREIVRKIRAAQAQIEQRRQSEPAPTYFADAQRELVGGAFPNAFPGWLFHKRPKIATWVIGREIPEPRHLPPVDVAGSPGLGVIALSWADGRNEYVEVTAYAVYRRDAEDGAWEKVADLDGAVHSYQDRSAEARKQYWYYVESKAAVSNRVLQAEQIELAEDQVRQRSIEIGPFQTQRDVYIEVVQVTAETLEDRIAGRKVDEQAWIKVYRHFTDEGQWRVSKQFVVPVGKPVGEVVKVRGQSIDFHTDYVLKDTDIRQIEKQSPGGFTLKVGAHFAVIEDPKTGESFEINNQVKDKALESVIDAMKGRGDEGE